MCILNNSTKKGNNLAVFKEGQWKVPELQKVIEESQIAVTPERCPL